jgi:GNAT superfamily N-acetyltransferase
MMDLVIRPACPEDIPHLCSLLDELFSLEADFNPDRSKQARGVELLISDQSGKVLVLAAATGGEIVGMCTVQTLISTAEGGPVGLVEDVIVRRDHRGTGIGARLLSEAADWCRARGLMRLQLLADRENRAALDFYTAQNWASTRLICLRKLLWPSYHH